MPRVKTHRANKDYPSQGIAKGDTYFKWEFRYPSTIHRSLKRPTRSQLTRSAFLQDLYALEDSLNWKGGLDDLDSQRNEAVASIETLRDQCQDNLDNMPEHLQDTSESGILLQERIDSLEDWQTGLEDVNLELTENDTLEDFDLEEFIESKIEELDACNPGLG